MSLLVFGKTGQVARELQAIVPHARFLSRTEANLSHPDTCAEAINRFGPSAVINAAAYTAVDKAESEEALATTINGTAPKVMAEACAAVGIPFVHISTDYVFSGTGTTPWNPVDLVGPISAYGRSKLAGEAGVRSAGGSYAILRTSWVFSAHGANFVKTMIRLGASRERLTVVTDQIGGPTPARTIAMACLRLAEELTIRPEYSGIYHFSGTPDVSWAGFAREIMEQAGLSCVIEGISTSAYPTAAQRPLNSRMDCSDLDRLSLSRPDWREGLAEVLQQIGEVK